MRDLKTIMDEARSHPEYELEGARIEEVERQLKLKTLLNEALVQEVEDLEAQEERDDLSNRAFGLAFAVIILIAMAIAYGAGSIMTRKEAKRTADIYWTTQMTKRHLAYWTIYPDGHKEIQYRCVPHVRATCVKYVDKDGNEINKKEVK